MRRIREERYYTTAAGMALPLNNTSPQQFSKQQRQVSDGRAKWRKAKSAENPGGRVHQACGQGPDAVNAQRPVQRRP